MKSGSYASKEDAPGSGGQSGRKPPHWRRREHVATAVYVVHPTQFRTVVQQLTGAGATSPPRLSTHQHAGGGGNGAGARTNAVAQAQARHGGGEQSCGTGGDRRRTLGQMYQECLAWANGDDS